MVGQAAASPVVQGNNTSGVTRRCRVAATLTAGGAWSPTSQAAAFIVTEAVHGRLVDHLAINPTNADHFIIILIASPPMTIK